MRRFLFATTVDARLLDEAALALLRVFTGLSLAFAHGLAKVPPSAGFIDGVGGLGFPLPVVFAWAAGLSELVGGALLALGLLTRPAALAIAGTMAVAAFLRHGGDPYAKQELALFYLVVALVFAVRGANRLSLDHVVSRLRPGA